MQKFYQGAVGGTLLRQIDTTYSGVAPSVTTITLGSQTARVETTYDSALNLTSLKEYAFGTAPPTAPVRTTTRTYLSTSPYPALNILDRMTQEKVQAGDASGPVKSLTVLTYDDSGSITSCPTGASQHNDAGYGCSFTTRGNLTSITRYTDPATPSGPITKHFTYDFFGNVRTADADCCQTQSWAYSSATQYAYPDSTTRGNSPTQLTTQATYNPYTGQLATATDENGQVTTYTYNDALRRLTDVQRPDGQHVTYGYDDSARTISVGSPVQAGATNKQVTYLDGLGRAIETRIRDASDTTYSIADTQYDPLGRTYRVTNPYTSTQYWNTTQYDALGRVTFVIPPDGSVSSNNTNYVYSGSSVTVTDPTGKQRQLQSDALGRVVTVYEPDVNNNNSLTQQTSYTYDVLDRLTQVSQGVQTRSYVYDGLGRLTSATTPETGNQAVQYQYNSYSLPTSRTDARGVITMRTCHAP